VNRAGVTVFSAWRASLGGMPQTSIVLMSGANA
jgi:hypothetical protein